MGSYLTIPHKEKQSEFGSGNRLSFGLSCMQGWRFSMEDAHIAIPFFTAKSSLFAVFDGHGGSQVSQFCSEFFPKEL